jgi:ketosteroid isomerase-like protein
MDAPNPADTQSLVLDYRDHPAFDETARANRQAIVDAMDAMAAGDADAFWSLFDPEVTFYEASCLPYGGAHQGLEATQKAFSLLCEQFSKMHSEFEAVLASRDIVILYQRIAFEAAKTGKSGGFPVAELFRFRNGKIVEWRAHYFDACAMAEALREER